MRIAYFSPLPPEKTGIGDYSFELLEVLREHLDIVAVVDDRHVRTAEAPEGIPIVGASAIEPTEYACAVYQMGNNSRFHRFIFDRALDEPGLLVMHDPSLADFHSEICAGADSIVFQEELAYDSPELDPYDLPRVDVGRGLRDLDRMAILLARRIVESSTRTLLNSGAMAEHFREKYPGADIASIRLPAQVVHARSGGERPGPGSTVVFGLFGGIAHYKRVRSALDAFTVLAGEVPNARLVIAGRPDDRLLTREIQRIIARPELRDVVDLRTDLTLDELEQAMAESDVAIQLRWPTAGEMSATLMRTFGAGRPAIVTAVPQFGDLDPAFCWQVPHEEGREIDALLGVMRRVAADPGAAWDAGQQARAFIAAEATYDSVARAYVEHVSECAARRRRSSSARSRWRDELRLGFNVVTASAGRAETKEAADALAAEMIAAGVDAVRVEVDIPYRPVDPPTQRPRPITKPDWPPRTRHDANEVYTSWFATRGPHSVDVLVVDEEYIVGFAEYAYYQRRREYVVVAYLAPEAAPVIGPVFRLLLEVDEVWTTSRFGVDALQIASPSPVLVLPPWMHSIRALPERIRRTLDRACRFLVVVDASGGFARPNVAGAVDAFCRAIPSSERGRTASLAIAILGEMDDGDLRYLDALVAPANAEVVRIRSASDRGPEIAQSDVLLAPSRSEPFGFAVAEAMALGVPVITTVGYGAPDCASFTAVAAVGARPAAVNRGTFHREPEVSRRFEDRQVWAAPDVEQIAQRIRALARDAEARRRTGGEGRDAIDQVRERSEVSAILRSRVVALQPAVLGSLAERTRRVRSRSDDEQSAVPHSSDVDPTVATFG